eukprot:s2757_g16.t1
MSGSKRQMPTDKSIVAGAGVRHRIGFSRNHHYAAREWRSRRLGAASADQPVLHPTMAQAVPSFMALSDSLLQGPASEAEGATWSVVAQRDPFEGTSPLGRLHFRAYDQKPLWFNAVGGSKTLALKGAKDVHIRENHHAARCRFTAMTKTVSMMRDEKLPQIRRRSHGSGDPYNLAILFKGETDRITTGLDVPDGCLVQTGPKGSYRVEQVLEFLRWDLGAADSTDGSQCEIVVLDWFSAHLDPAVDQLIKASKQGYASSLSQTCRTRIRCRL